MRASLQSNLRLRSLRGFTLIELIFVLALLAIAAVAVAPRMTSFFRGRALSEEARRMLSLTHYGQSRAVAEGVPILLWVNPKESSYGLMVQAGFADADGRSATYFAEPGLTLETPTAEAPAASENDDEKLGLPTGLSVIRFTPDGFYDENSVSKIIIRQGTEGALALVPTTNRLAYEILPVATNQP